MLILTGTVLVLLSWAAVALILGSVGLLVACLTRPGPCTGATLRSGLWWGLVLVTLFTYAANHVWPLHSSQVATAAVLAAVLVAVPGWAVAVRRGIHLPRTPRAGTWLVTGSIALAVGYLAVASLGPVTNYDSGLYHLGAIKYAGDYAAIPGLANLYFPLGYGNAEFPLAALLGNGPWGDQGYRLLNGLVIGLAAIELVARLRGRRLSAGFFILAVGLVSALIPLVALADYWVTSPTQDSSVLVLTVVATAYLADALTRTKAMPADAATAIALAILLILLRPTMAVFGVALVAVVVLRSWRLRRAVGVRAFGRPGLVVVGVAALAVGLATLRDYVLSGWLQFPLSVHAFDVPWLAPDPTGSRLATLGNARNPDDIWGSVDGWAWVGPWVSRLPSQWETYQFGLMAVVAVVILVVALRRSPGLRLRSLMLCMAPSALALVAWWVLSPPAFRFAWGPFFTLAAIPLGWGLWRLVVPRREEAGSAAAWWWVLVAGMATPLVAVVAVTAVARADWTGVTDRQEWSLGPVSLHYAVALPPQAVVTEATLSSGLVVLMPVRSDQCWAAYPLCTPQPTPTLGLRKESIQGGFVQ